MKNLDLLFLEYLKGLRLASLSLFLFTTLSCPGSETVTTSTFFSLSLMSLSFSLSATPDTSSVSSDLSVLTSSVGGLGLILSLVTLTTEDKGVEEEEVGMLYLQHLWKEKSLQLNLSLRQKGGIFCLVVVVRVVVGDVVVV